MVFGREPPDLTEIAAEVEMECNIPIKSYMENLEKSLQKIKQIVVDQRMTQQQTQKKRQERTHPDYQTFAKGDFVMFKRPQLSELQTGTKKFNRPWIGPVKVASVLSTDKYLIADWDGLIPPVIMGRHELKPYIFQQHTAKNLYHEIKTATALFRSLEPILKQRNEGKADSPTARRPSE